ncbi:hypothetical protein CICLE_v10027417mg [Citrus x clementina]|uniref:Uncharacterized protein n=1 Tax=Citrus clementina TaxID=85681 RepID=V4SMJ4_CITCL|nr:hypothetical protein CICLE_v10027417mg [Citrus x clementina]
MPPRTEVKPKSVRKPLRDLPNNNNGGGRLSKSANLKKKSRSDRQIEDEALDDDSTLDRLLLVQSDLSSLLQQIDELVVQALKVKTMSKQGRKEVEAFTSVLSEMLSTLKPWVPRFQKVLCSPIESEKQLGESLISKTVSTTIDENVCEFGSPEEVNNEDTLISPSPLVSWRANCTIERGRQLFLLTPLPMSKTLSSKCQDPSKSRFERITSKSTVEIPPPLTIPGDANDDLLEGVEIKPTPSKPADSTDSDGLAFKYPELLGIRQACKSGIVWKDLEASPLWKFSPPKSCVLLEPTDEISTEKAAADDTLPTNKSHLPEPFGGNSALIESTPLWKEPESTFRTGKRPGENTLKKELWTRFEAASTFGVHYNASAVERTTRKGFLDMLEEASCDEENSVLDGLR